MQSSADHCSILDRTLVKANIDETSSSPGERAVTVAVQLEHVVEIAESDVALEVRRAVRSDLVLDNTTAALTRRLDRTAPERSAST
jgi:hypothetical protein